MSKTAMLTIGLLFAAAGGLWYTNRQSSYKGASPKGTQLCSDVKRLSLAPKAKNENIRRFTVKRFATTQTGETVVPILKVEQPKFVGPAGAIRTVKVWQELEIGIGTDDPYIDLPSGQGITKFIILLQSREPNGEPSENHWRVWELPAQEAWESPPASIKLPDHTKLPVLDERNDRADLLRLFQAAEEYRNTLR